MLPIIPVKCLNGIKSLNCTWSNDCTWTPEAIIEKSKQELGEIEKKVQVIKKKQLIKE